METILARNMKKEKEIKIDNIVAMQGNPREAALLGYLAGIMDGEGCIGIKKYLPKGIGRKPCYFVYLSMGMQFKEIPLLFQKLFGGSCNEERVQRKVSMWRWNAQGKVHVTAILNVLLPYLRVKKDQALLALDCCKTWDLQQREGRNLLHINDAELLKREDSYLLMRKLKHLEAPATTEREDTRDSEATV